ncbi:11879_t:CDS:2 [Entrophospora sp. SA101]|nr:11879_t:CDS:2 [Entrophospora sp. SA101]
MSSSNQLSVNQRHQICNHPRVGLGVFVVKDDKFLIGKRKGSHGSGTDKNIQDDPHSKIIEILRESSASSPSQTTDSQVKYARQFMEGELYSPQDLDEESYKTKRVGRFIRKTPNVDVFTKLNLDPLVEYKVINKNKYFYEIEID